jgi:hypothetical protein
MFVKKYKFYLLPQKVYIHREAEHRIIPVFAFLPASPVAELPICWMSKTCLFDKLFSCQCLFKDQFFYLVAMEKILS